MHARHACPGLLCIPGACQTANASPRDQPPRPSNRAFRVCPRSLKTSMGGAAASYAEGGGLHDRAGPRRRALVLPWRCVALKGVNYIKVMSTLSVLDALDAVAKGTLTVSRPSSLCLDQALDAGNMGCLSLPSLRFAQLSVPLLFAWNTRTLIAFIRARPLSVGSGLKRANPRSAPVIAAAG